VKLTTSIITISVLIYFLDRKFTTVETQQKIKLLRTFIGIADSDSLNVDEMVVSAFQDLEDSLQHSIAIHNNCHTLITRNKKDYKHASLPVMNAAEFLKK
jgi:predicted transcriptional regulator